jgi:hypothetical protein
MALTQMQIIQSLGDAMSWFERELSWGVKATEISHLIGRIGELYAALITNGQMATQTNQAGYDVVSALGEKISVKTTAIMKSSGHISFNQNTLEQVDKIIILRVNTEEMQIETLFNDNIAAAKKIMSIPSTGKASISLSKLVRSPKPSSEIPIAKSIEHRGYVITELSNGAIEVTENGALISPTIRVLRELAKDLSVNHLNNNGNKLNTQQLGSNIIKAVQHASDQFKA